MKQFVLHHDIYAGGAGDISGLWCCAEPLYVGVLQSSWDCPATPGRSFLFGWGQADPTFLAGTVDVVAGTVDVVGSRNPSKGFHEKDKLTLRLCGDSGLNLSRN
jgi:hypothetical protein